MRISAFIYRAIGNISLGIFLIALAIFARPSLADGKLIADLQVSWQQASFDGSDLGVGIGCRILPNENGPSAFICRLGYSYLESVDFEAQGYLRPELGYRFSHGISKRSSIFAEAAIGYSFGIDTASYEGTCAFLGAGFEWVPVPIFSLSAFVRASPIEIPFGSDNGYSSYGGGIGFAYHFGFRDSDRDWVPNDADNCHDTPRGARVDEMGCATDHDGDGVFDGLDRCHGTPFTAMVDSLGCPLDSDGDGVFDGVDRCDDTPNDIAVDSAGCPRDSDGDGVIDYIDTCSNTTNGASVDEFGCPMDSDEDGVFDGIDLCPQTPSGFVVNSLGCPFVAPVESEEIRDAYESGLNLKASAMQKLDNIAERLRAYPFRIVEIGVYTDGEGSATYNVNRGYRVAEKVRDVLAARGVDREQLKLKGYGEIDPVSSNATADGKKQNRRIVFRYLEDR